MAGVVQAIEGILKKSFNLKLWIYNLAAYLIPLLLLAVISFVLVFAGVLIASPMIAVLDIASLIPIILIFGAILLVLFYFFSVLLTGWGMNLNKDFLETGNLSLKDSFHKTTPRLFTAFFLKILFTIIVLLFIAVIFAPFALGFIDSVQSKGIESALLTDIFLEDYSFSETMFVLIEGFLENLTSFLAAVFALIIAGIVFTPFFLLLEPVVFFENNSVIGTLKRAISLSFANFFRNWGFFLLFYIIVMIISTVIGIAGVLAIAIPLIGIAVYIIATIIIILWSLTFSYLFYAKLYNLNTEQSLPSFEKTFIQTSTLSDLAEEAKQTPMPKPQNITKPKPKTKKKK